MYSQYLVFIRPTTELDIIAASWADITILVKSSGDAFVRLTYRPHTLGVKAWKAKPSREPQYL